MIPENVKNNLRVLAKAFHEGEDVLDELYDLVCEMGFPGQARFHFGRDYSAHCIPGCKVDSNPTESRCGFVSAVLEEDWEWLESGLETIVFH